MNKRQIQQLLDKLMQIILENIQFHGNFWISLILIKTLLMSGLLSHMDNKQISNLERIEFLQEKSWLLFFFWFFIYFLVFLVLFVKSRLGFGFGLKMGLKGATFSKKYSQEQHIAHYTDWSRSQTSVHHFLKSRTFTFFFFRIVVHQYGGETNL